MPWCAPYIGSLSTLIVFVLLIMVVILVDRGWLISLGVIALFGTGFGIDWALTDHGKKADDVFYSGNNLIVPKWVFVLKRDLGRHSQNKGYEWKHRLYRCWISTGETSYLLYAFPQIPWFNTVIGFEDESSRQFYLDLIQEIYELSSGETETP